MRFSNVLRLSDSSLAAEALTDFELSVDCEILLLL